MDFKLELTLTETRSRNDRRSCGRAAFWFILFCDKLHGSYYTSLYLAGVLRRNYLSSFYHELYK